MPRRCERQFEPSVLSARGRNKTGDQYESTQYDLESRGISVNGRSRQVVCDEQATEDDDEYRGELGCHAQPSSHGERTQRDHERRRGPAQGFHTSLQGSEVIVVQSS
jgi:hypothetical protein